MSLFKPGNELYYVNPFVFIIDKVLIEFIEEDGEQGITYYVDHSGAYLAEHDLHETLSAAQQWALNRLNEFYVHKMHDIVHANPEIDFEEGD